MVRMANSAACHPLTTNHQIASQNVVNPSMEMVPPETLETKAESCGMVTTELEVAKMLAAHKRGKSHSQMAFFFPASPCINYWQHVFGAFGCILSASAREREF